MSRARFADVNVVRLAVELFGDVHLGFRSFNVDVGADEGALFAFLLVARSGSWYSGGWLPKLWWSAKDLGHLSACLQETPVL